MQNNIRWPAVRWPTIRRLAIRRPAVRYCTRPVVAARLPENLEQLFISFSVMNHQRFACRNRGIDMPTQRCFLDLQGSRILRVVPNPVGIQAGFPDRNTVGVRNKLSQNAPSVIIQGVGLGGMDCTSRENRIKAPGSVQGRLGFGQSVANCADLCYPGCSTLLDRLFQLSTHTCQMSVGISQTSNSGKRSGHGARFFLRHAS